MVALLPALGLGLFLLASVVAGVRLLALARRTRRLPAVSNVDRNCCFA